MSSDIPLAGSKAMLVEDDDDLRDATAAALTRDGCRVTTARDGGEALELLTKGHRPDVIVLDLMMPNVDGWEFRMRQKADPSIAGIPVIALSSDESPKAAAIDATHYLRKPVDYSLLRDALAGTVRASRLAHSERLAALGRLSAGIAHEVKNPLTTVVVALAAARDNLRELLAGSPSPRDQAERAATADELLESAQTAVDRIQSIVRDVAVFAHPDATERSFLDLRSILESTVRVIGSQLRERARVELDLQPVPMVHANASLLGQVCLNLLLNATQALPPDRPGIVRARTAIADDGSTMLEISDNGEGMTEEVRSRVFTPFFSTKPVATGTGLGLSLCHAILISMNGRIEVSSVVGRGSTFRVFLPAVPGTFRTPSARPSARRRLLLVDDETAITRVLARALRDLDIECAASASEAIAILERTDFDLVLSDVHMPGTSGIELYDEVSGRWPEKAARFAFMTGNPGTPAILAFRARTGRIVLEKPFRPEVVVELLHGAAKAGQS